MNYSKDIKSLTWQEFAGLDHPETGSVSVEDEGNKFYLDYCQKLPDHDRFSTRVPADCLSNSNLTWEDILDEHFNNEEVINTFKALQQLAVEELDDLEATESDYYQDYDNEYER